MDHGNSLEMVAECLDAGFTSVMLDASQLPFNENIALTQKAVKMAGARCCDTEGEIGEVDWCLRTGGRLSSLVRGRRMKEFETGRRILIKVSTDA